MFFDIKVDILHETFSCFLSEDFNYFISNFPLPSKIYEFLHYIFTCSSKFFHTFLKQVFNIAWRNMELFVIKFRFRIFNIRLSSPTSFCKKILTDFSTKFPEEKWTLLTDNGVYETTKDIWLNDTSCSNTKGPSEWSSRAPLPNRRTRQTGGGGAECRKNSGYYKLEVGKFGLPRTNI